MWDKLKSIWQVKEVRNGLLFVIVMMVIFRIAANIPLPGIDLVALQRFFDSNQALGMLNLFSGGTMRTFSIVAMGVAPYITASIIFQLLGMIVPRIEEIQKEGEAGQRRINQWTRWLTIPLAILQSFSLLSLMRQSQVQILRDTSALHIAVIVFGATAGTVFLMWIGELISEKKVGNGVSLMIFAGILASLPTAVSQFMATYDSSQLFYVLLYAAIAILTVVGVVFVTEGQRNVPVQYARQTRGMSASVGGVTSSLPLRVNMVGVIPIIFAISLLILPSIVAQFLTRAKTLWIENAARWIIVTLQNQWVYGIAYFLLVVGFTYFYTAVVFHPEQVAENLQKQGGFIPGIRPGKPTSDYLQNIIQRITLGGALFLGLIAVLPVIVQGFSGTRSLALGGTSLLIVVSVVIESVKQIESQLTMREYDAY
ncbi:MAG TPA: preprotein translocase subunit SecY [Patescibacteria group bacterium]|nr:preprotein translocase subunit SecY [Patescibacteria group bacterium]